MLNFIWAGMILVGIVYATLHGNIDGVTNAALESSKEAIALCLTMLGVMSFWMGLMEIATKAGIIEGLSKLLRPFLHFMFPKIPKNHEANSYIAANFIANILGLGWACTPTGIKAMQALKQLEEERGNHTEYASNEMCTFLIINISSLQLIPINMIAYRTQYGSANPMAVVGPALIATMLTTIFAIIVSKVLMTCIGKKKGS